jgi:aminoglycoside phosphotransferase (APT) family kinase protein
MPSTWARSSATCRRAWPGFEGPLAVEQFKGGQSNPTFTHQRRGGALT